MYYLWTYYLFMYIYYYDLSIFKSKNLWFMIWLCDFISRFEQYIIQ